MSARSTPSPGAHQRRPLTARSVIASTLLGTHPPWMPTRLLVRTGELFGVSEGTIRTAISRMAAAGELAAEGDGYRLVGPMLERQTRQDASRRAERHRWDGTWELAIVREGGRDAAARTELREAMRRLALAELREGTWLRPANLDADRLAAQRAVVDAQCTTLRATPDDDPAALAAALWDLDGWARDARALADELAALGTRLRAGDTEAMGPAFVASAAVLRHLLADPLLPDELVPADWPGAELRSTYDEVNVAFLDLFGTWLLAQR